MDERVSSMTAILQDIAQDEALCRRRSRKRRRRRRKRKRKRRKRRRRRKRREKRRRKRRRCGRRNPGKDRRRIFVMPTSNRRSLPTRMRRIVQWLKLKRRLETLARQVGISDELDVEVWPRAEYLHFRSLVAEHGYCGRP